MRDKLDLPRIGVSWVTLVDLTSARYLNAVRVGGGQPVALPAAARSWASELGTIGGLLLTGGGDVDPALYGEENRGLSRGINRQRDDLESEALRFCVERALPILAICRGMQLVNVALGGALIQDLQSEVRHRTGGEESAYHEIAVYPESRLAAVLGVAANARVNSRHHQGVDLARVAPKLRVTALADDGIVEGLELEGDPFLVAVQCHPEYLDQVPALNGLFADLVSRARDSQDHRER